MEEAIIDFKEVSDVRKIHELLNESVFHIDFYGHNLDALHDTLDGLAKRPYKVTFKNISSLPFTQASQLETMLVIFLMDCSSVEKTGETINFNFEN